jgi:hypothetical protein
MSGIAFKKRVIPRLAKHAEGSLKWCHAYAKHYALTSSEALSLFSWPNLQLGGPSARCASLGMTAFFL